MPSESVLAARATSAPRVGLSCRLDVPDRWNRRPTAYPDCQHDRMEGRESGLGRVDIGTSRSAAKARARFQRKRSARPACGARRLPQRAADAPTIRVRRESGRPRLAIAGPPPAMSPGSLGPALDRPAPAPAARLRAAATARRGRPIAAPAGDVGGATQYFQVPGRWGRRGRRAGRHRRAAQGTASTR
jgi:hypothetical protein